MGFDDKMLVIRKNDFLAKLTQEQYDSLNIIHNYVIADRDDFIYFDSQSLNKLYFVKKGYVRIGYVDEEGNDIIRDILKPGDVFGQFALEPHNKSGEYAIAYKTKVALCTFSISDFKALLEKNPGLAVEYAKKIGRQMHRIENRLMNLLQKDVRARLLYFFWTLLQHHSTTDSGLPLVIDNYFTHEDIARLTGTSRQTATTLINQFSEEGLLDLTRKKITIRNIKLLRKELNVG